jgi:hypothetical protein
VHLVAGEAAISEGQTLFHQTHEMPDILFALVGLRVSGLIRSPFRDGKQLALQGAMIASSTALQFRDHFGGHILD